MYLFGPPKDNKVLFDPEQATRYSMDPGTREAATTCWVAKVLVKEDTSVKQGDPLFVLYRPLPPPPPVPEPMDEHFKLQIKEELERKTKQYKPATIVVDRPHHYNVADPGPQLLVNFNKFDTVADCSDHLFAAQETQQPSSDWVNKIQEDRRILMAHLPDTIFVRVYESRMDILRAAFIGQKGTPYHNGLFFFDVCFPIEYPYSPPLVRYHSGVPGISPHLNEFGDVSLFVCNELGLHEHMWIPGTSNMIQLLVCIQDLMLNARPLFNISEAARSMIDSFQESKSLLFNENTLVKSLETMIYTMSNPPKNFENLVLGHFHTHVHDILRTCMGYIEGKDEEVGCLIVSDSNHAPSMKFKKDVTSCLKPLVEAFDSIGAKEARGYLYLTQEKSALPANVYQRIRFGSRTRFLFRFNKRNVTHARFNKRKVHQGIRHNKRKAEEDINPAAKKVAVAEATSDPTEKEGKVAEEVNAVVTEKNKVVVDEGTNSSLVWKTRKVYSKFTIIASADCVIDKVLVSVGTKVEEGQPLYVIGPRKTQYTLQDIVGRKEPSYVEYLTIRKILLMNRRSHVGIFSMENVLVDHHQQLEDSSPMARGLGEEDVQKRFKNFSKFGFVKEISDHFYSTKSSAPNQPSKEWVERIHEDWATFEKQLPDTIFVRVDHSRMDLFRAVMIGPSGTPYRDGLFFFDVCIPCDYPSSPPLVHYNSVGFCINPNINKCGQVKLSLPKTTGSQEMMWVPGTSTLADLLGSIQNQILSTKPVYNDVTYATMRGSICGQQISGFYNWNTIVKSLKTMVHVMKKPPQGFEDFVVGHFRDRVHDILELCDRKAHSVMFKDDLTASMQLLIGAFDGIGAHVPEKFLP